ncbi:MAG: hypothetical protein IKV94_06080 [Clostridia bacterium]|nr:hypothetical protein [Clostridia bacterium]
MNNNNKFLEFRSKYPKFIYDSFDIEESDDTINVTYSFIIEGLSNFKPSWVFQKPNYFNIDKFGRDNFNILVFNLGLVELVSYWKITCSPTIEIRAGFLDTKQIEWWKKLYLNGLGEFLYINGIYDNLKIENDIIDSQGIPFMTIVNSSKRNCAIEKVPFKLEGNLIPVGGGKDSVVTLELLKDSFNVNTCYIVNPRGASLTTANIAGYSEVYAPKRTLDVNMLELNKQGYLNGHTPFSAVLAFSAYISAVILAKQNIVLSNESSANEPNVEGTNINHQYSKSLDFENDFRWYCDNYLLENGPQYFSLLRPWSEWQIVREFSKHPQYFKDFKSCNVGSKKDIWCENCAKCLYVYIMLCAFLEEEDIKTIFNKDLLNDIELKHIFEGLVYSDTDKPFECVGTKEEINLSLNIYIRKLKEKGKEIPALLKSFEILNEETFNKLLKQYEVNFDTKNNLNETFKKCLKEVNY